MSHAEITAELARCFQLNYTKHHGKTIISPVESDTFAVIKTVVF